MRRQWMCMGVAALGLLCAPVRAAETLDDVQKAIKEASAKITSMQCKNTSTTNFEMAGMKSSSQNEGTFEYLKKGDKWLYRSEMKGRSLRMQEGKEEKTTDATTIVCDGEFVYTLTEVTSADGKKQTMAYKMKSPPQSPLDGTAYLDSMKSSHSIKLLPDDKVDGKDCWVIEFTPKDANIPAMRTVAHIQKETGFSVKTASFDKDNKAVTTSTTSDIKTNPTLAADRFVFKAPEGVQVMDMSKMGQAEGAGGGDAAKPAEPAKPADPKKGDDPNKPADPKPELPKPRLPGMPK